MPQRLERVEALWREHRERPFPPTETLSMFLAQVLCTDGSYRQVVNDAAVKRRLGGLPRCSANTRVYGQARGRLPLAMASQWARETGQRIAAGVLEGGHWRSRPVRLVDGATVKWADTEAHPEAYPQPGSQPPGLGFPQGRIVALRCLGSGALLDAATGLCPGQGRDEQSLLRGLLGRLEARATTSSNTTSPRSSPTGWTRTNTSALRRDGRRAFKAGGKILVTMFLCPVAAPKAVLKAL
jgi:hypothetical protein